MTDNNNIIDSALKKINDTESDKKCDIIIVGGGAAGFFAAINAKINNPNLSVTILEQSKEVLNKVRISGGGRCNVTNACFDPRELTGYYPRGAKELLGPFHIFGSRETVIWFENYNVSLYTEPNGCMFPVSNNSDTIIRCFLDQATKLGIKIIRNVKVKDFQSGTNSASTFTVFTEYGDFTSRFLMLATGSSPFVWNMLEKHGYKIVAPVPSLFTFNLPKHPICDLMGLVVQDVNVKIKETKICTDGPLLITHWGLSGPAVLKASAWGATILSDRNYNFTVTVDWIPATNSDTIDSLRNSLSKKKVISNPQFGIPTRLWHFLISKALTDIEKNWASLSKKEMGEIITQLKNCPFVVQGKTTFKEEFVTAGGVELQQINFRTFESRLHPGLFLAGEVINIDALTGGFNFQAAWTGGYLAGVEMAKRI